MASPKVGSKRYKGPVHEAVRKSPLGKVAGKQGSKPKARTTTKKAPRTTAASKVAANRSAAADAAKAQGYVKNSSGTYVKASTSKRPVAGPTRARRTGYSSPPTPKPTKKSPPKTKKTKTTRAKRKKG